MKTGERKARNILNIIPAIVIIFLIARSGLDIFKDIAVYVGPLKINIVSALSLLMIILTAVYCFIVRVRFKKDFYFDKVSKAFLIWIITLLPWVLLSIVNYGTNGVVSVREWVRLFSVIVVYLVVFNLSRTTTYEKIINLLFLSLIIPLGVSFYQVILGKGKVIAGILRIPGSFVHPNPFAFYLVIFIGLTFWKFRFSKKKMPWFLLLLIESWMLITTFSLSGVVMLGVLTVIMIIGEKTKHRLVLMFFLIGFVLVFLFTKTGQMRIAEQLATGKIGEIVETGRVYSSLDWRILNWHLLLSQWVKTPWVGYGLHTSIFINPMKLSAGLGAGPHNDYLLFLVELGIIGFSLFLIFLFVIIRETLQFYKQASESKEKSLSLVVLACYICWLVGSLTDNLITATAFQYYLWSLLAIVSGTVHNYRTGSC